MSLFTASLNSGSNGNCYYVGNKQDGILVDAGISCREIERRLLRLGIPADRLRAVFISHEHSDHIRGLARFSARHRLPVYISPLTYEAMRHLLPQGDIRFFRCDQPVAIGQLSILPFPKFHDAAEPYSFVVRQGEVRIGVFTDIGRVCQQVIRHFRTCQAVYLESNYDEELLANGRYPYFLKQRIRGGRGHLSNREALNLFLEHRTEQLSHLFLSHLSKDNNCPQLVADLFGHHRAHTEIIVASRDEESLLVEIKSVAVSEENVNAYG